MARALLFFILNLLVGCRHPAEKTPVTIPVILPFDKNPSGNWEIGYSLHDTISLSAFRLCHFADTSDTIGLWHPDTSAYYPYTGQNRSTTLQMDPTNSWSARPGEIVMEGSNTGQYSMVRFIVPSSGQYKLNATFEGVHIRLSSTDVHILLNDQHLFDDIIDGYGGDPSVLAQQGAHPAATWAAEIHLNKGDILTFAIGYGANKTFYNDTTGLLLSIEAG